MNQKNDISVIINTYNRKKLLFRAFQSVITQSQVDLEVIIVNDYPQEKIIKKQLPALPKNIKLKIVNNSKNLGLAMSRNIGVQNCSRNYIAFLDDDDYWLDENKLIKQREYFNLNTNLSICYTDIIDSNNKNQSCEYPGNSSFWQKNGFLYPSTVMMRKKDIIEVGGFDIRFERGIDSDLYRRIILIKKKPFYHLKIGTTYYTVMGSDSITNFQENNKFIKAINSQLLTLRKYKLNIIIYPKALFGRIKIILWIFFMRLKF